MMNCPRCGKEAALFRLRTLDAYIDLWKEYGCLSCDTVFLVKQNRKDREKEEE